MLALRLAAAWAGTALSFLASVGYAQEGPSSSDTERQSSTSPVEPDLTSAQNCLMPRPGLGGAIAPGSLEEPDPTVWSLWWRFNQKPYLYKAREGAEEQDLRRPSEDQIRGKIVPALLQALETETSSQIAVGCMMALAKIGKEGDGAGTSGLEEVLRSRLKSQVQEISEIAAVSLGILGSEDSVTTLVDLLRDTAAGRVLVDDDEVGLRTRAFAAYGLSLIGARTERESTRQTILQNLVAVLESDRSHGQDLKVACLIGLGVVHLERIRPDAATEEGALAAQSSRSGQIDYLLAFFQDQQNHCVLRAHAPAAAARLLDGLPPGERQAYKQCLAEALLACLAAPSQEQAEGLQGCVLALGQIGDNDADPLDVEIRRVLIDASRHVPDQQARNLSLIALAQVGGRAGLGAAAETDDVALHLTSILQRGQPSLRPWAGLAIGVYGRALTDAGRPAPAAAVAALRTQLALEQDSNRVGAYAVGLGLLEDLESKEVLLSQLEITNDDRNDEMRGYVALGLGLMRARDALKPIQDSMKNSGYHPALKYHSDDTMPAVSALGLVGNCEVAQSLIKTLAKAKALLPQHAAAAALGSIGDPRSVDPLVALLLNTDLSDGSRGYAAAALGLLADKEALPWTTRFSIDLNYRAATFLLYDGYFGLLDRL